MANSRAPGSSKMPVMRRRRLIGLLMLVVEDDDGGLDGTPPVRSRDFCESCNCLTSASSCDVANCLSSKMPLRRRRSGAAGDVGGDSVVKFCRMLAISLSGLSSRMPVKRRRRGKGDDVGVVVVVVVFDMPVVGCWCGCWFVCCWWFDCSLVGVVQFVSMHRLECKA
jgi:hypothetical protein